MVNYKFGKIYKLIDNTNGNVYVGSTAETTLARRLSGHRGKCKAFYMKGQGNYVKSFDIINNNDYKIILIEEYPCESKDQLLQREQQWMDKIDCINQVRANGHDRKKCVKKYDDKNKAKSKEYQRKVMKWKYTWGGDINSHNNNLLKIKLSFFD